MKLSIIIPVYNAEPYLKRCLDSVVKGIEVNEAEEDVEVIVIDDASTDNSLKIMKQFEEEHDFFWIKKNEINKGVSYTRNVGLGICTGEFVTFLDADDEYTDMGISFMLDYIDSAFDDIEEADDIVHWNHYRKNYSTEMTTSTSLSQGYYHNFDILPPYWVGVWNKLFKTSFLSDNNISFIETLRYGEDELFMLECLEKAKCMYVFPYCTILKHVQENPNCLGLSVRPYQLGDQLEALVYIHFRTLDYAIRHLTKKLIIEHMGSKAYRRVMEGKEGL